MTNTLSDTMMTDAELKESIGIEMEAVENSMKALLMRIKSQDLEKLDPQILPVIKCDLVTIKDILNLFEDYWSD